MLLHHSQRISGKFSIFRPGFLRVSVAICSTVITICFSIVVARTLGPTAFGVYAFVLWLATVTMPALGIGMSSLTSRHVTGIQSCQEPRLVAGVFCFVWKRQCRSILLYCLIFLGLAFPLAWFFGANAPLPWLLLAGLSALPLLLSSIVGITLRSLRRFDVLSAISLFGSAISFALAILATQVRDEQMGVFLLVSALASTMALTLGLICILRLLPFRVALPPSIFIRDRLTRGVHNSLLLFLLDCIVWQRSEMLLLARGHSSAELGFYALSSLISLHVMEFAPALLSTCLLPLLLRYTPGQGYINAADAFRKTSCYVAAIALPLCALAIACCPILVGYLLGAAYLPIVTPLRILLVSAAFGSIATVSLTHLAAAERKRAQVRLGIGAALLNLVLAIPFIVLWGVIGAAIASAVAQVVSAVGSILLCRKLMFG